MDQDRFGPDQRPDDIPYGQTTAPAEDVVITKRSVETARVRASRTTLTRDQETRGLTRNQETRGLHPGFLIELWTTARSRDRGGDRLYGTTMTVETQILPPHIEDTVEAIAKLHADHHLESGKLQRLVEHPTAWIGRPQFIALLFAVIVVWTTANLIVFALGEHRWIRRRSHGYRMRWRSWLCSQPY
jgi:hypothetical protein